MGRNLDAFKEALGENDIVVDSVMDTGMDVSLMYVHDDENKTEQVATVALLYAKAPQISANVLSVTPLTSDGRDAERVANYAIERTLAEQYNADEIPKKEYVQQVLNTWSEFK